MSDPKIKLKRSSVEGKIPTPDQVPLGELALNTYDGQLYASKNVGVGTTVIAINPFKVGTGTDSYDAYFTQGNVGIGTEVPDGPAHSSNSSVLNVGVVTANYLYGDGSNISNISGIVVSGVGYWEKTDAGINTSTNIGIGTTNPTSALTVSGDANVTGVVTATSFVGDVTGDATGLSGSPSITVTDITASGNVSIAGTLTYEDVTNVDSIGLITARSGIIATGVVTATSFSGDGSNLTGLATALSELTNDVGFVTFTNVSQLSNDSGYITTSFTSTSQLTNDAGFITNVVSGVLTATSFSGDGSNLTGLQAGHFEKTNAGIHTLSNIGIGTTNPTSALTVSGDADVTGNIVINSISEIGATIATLSTTTQTAIATISASTYRSVEFTIQVTQGTNYHTLKVLSLHDGTTVSNSQYGEIFTTSSLATFDVNLSAGGSIQLLATGTSANSTVYKVAYTAIKV